MKQLRYYQRQAIDAAIWGFEEYNSQVLALATGSGKTLVAAKIIEAFLPGRCLFLCDQRELLSQAARTFTRDIGVIPGIDAAKSYAPLEAEVVIASSQTLEKKERLERWPRDHFALVIHDECHRRPDIASRISEHFIYARKLGLTGTPFRAAISSLGKWYESVAYSKPVIDLIEEGFSPPIKIANLQVTFDLSSAKVKRGLDGKDYDLESIDSIIAPHYAEIAEQLRIHAQGRHGVAFLPLIRSSESFASALRQAGLRAAHVDGTSPDRKEIIERFDRGEIDWLCNSNLISTGVDIPIADAFLNLRLTASRVFYQQARGRTLRVIPGVIDHLPEKHQAEERKAAIKASAKPDTIIFDVLLQNDVLGTVRGMDVLVSSEEDAKAATSAMQDKLEPEDALAMAREIQARRELALIEALERAAIRSHMSTPMRTAEIGALLNEHSLIDYIPLARWEQAPATRAQIVALEGKLVDTRSIRSKGEASILLDVLINRANAGYSSVKQIKLLKQFNEMHPDRAIPHPEKLSIQVASDLISQCLKAR